VLRVGQLLGTARTLLRRNLSARKRFRLRLRALFIIVGVVAGYVTSLLLELHYDLWSAVSALFVLIAALGEFVAADILTESRYPARTQALLEKLEENLQEYHERIRESIDRAIRTLNACDSSRVSGTFHLVVDLFTADGDESEEALLQIAAYAGPQGGKRWRFTSAGKGVIGRCLRSGRSEYVNFASLDEYEERMVREFGFSRKEVAEHTKEARSYWAEPVQHRGRFVGVIYLFSTEPQVFPLAAETAIMQGLGREIGLFLVGAGVVDA
jgi:GAF domain-containing protein